MSLFGPQLQSRLVADGFRCPIPAGTTFRAGDIVPVGASLVGQAACDYNALGSTSTPNSLNLVGVIVCPKGSTEAIAAGVKVAWSTTGISTTSTTASLGIATATSGGTTPITHSALRSSRPPRPTRS